MVDITVMQLIRKVRSPDSKIVLQAIEELRARGGLSNGALAGAYLQHTHLQGADLFKANLQGADLRGAKLQWADLSMAELQNAKLNRANLYQADLSEANLLGADLFKANLQGARNLAEDQLAQVSRLRGATMPDGSPYDGRFNLPGDHEFVRGGLVEIDRATIVAATGSVSQLIRMLRSPDNRTVLQAVEGLRAGGWLSSGALEGLQLRYAHLEGANLREASLYRADLRMADLQGADLGAADLREARLSRASLRGADFHMADLQGAHLSRAILQGALRLGDDQLGQAHRLRGAMLADGGRYNGRFNLAGDLEDAQRLNIDRDDPAAMADFYGVALEDYVQGQTWMQAYPAFVWESISQKSKHATRLSLSNVA